MDARRSHENNIEFIYDLVCRQNLNIFVKEINFEGIWAS